MKGNHFSRFGASPVDTTNSNNNNNVRSSSPGAHSSLDDSMSQQGGGGAGGLMMMGDNSDYRDTVMYLAQQQNMNHQEMMSMLRQVLGALASSSSSSNLAAASGSGGKGGAAPLQQQYAYSPTGPLGAVVAAGDQQQQPYVPELEYRLKKVTDYAQTVENPAVVKELVLPATSGAYLATQQGWYQGVNALELELTAAKTRIQQLEQRNKLLQEQLQQKEQTIQRLTEMNVANVSRRIGGGSSAGGASPAVVGGFITPSRQQHAEAVGELSSGLAVSGSPALRELLKKHQASCSQLLA